MILMSRSQSITLITGPSGAGKSSVARKLALETKQCAEIDIESINYMIVDGFRPTVKNGQEVFDFTNWELAANTISVLVEHFAKHNYDVVIHGHVTDEFIQCLESSIQLTCRVLLLPALEIVLERDRQRGKQLTMGDAMVKDHYHYFITNHFATFIKVDSTNMSLDQTTAMIKAMGQDHEPA